MVKQTPAKAKATNGLALKSTIADDKARFALCIAPGDDAGDLPDRFALNNNYPNPFNPSTNLEFTLPIQSRAILTIHDILGRQISTIVNEELPAGIHTYSWNAARYASSVYLIQLMTQEGSFVKKMTLIK